MSGRAWRTAALAALIVSSACGSYSPPASTARAAPAPADSALIGRILLAEDRRDSNDVALSEGRRSSDERIRLLARRALGRIRDSQFTARDSLPSLRSPPKWTEPAWRLRYRALRAHRADCGAIQVALADSAWPVRLAAADLLTTPCATGTVLDTLRRWIDALPADAGRRVRGGVSWHAAAHALTALARVRSDDAGPLTRALASHGQWHVRMYAARAASMLGDTATLRVLARDPDDNVKEAAIDGLRTATGHASDDVYVAALDARGAQAVRAAARALAGSERPDARSLLNATFDRWAAHANASERDVRLALLQAAGRPPADDRPPLSVSHLPPRAVALALGADVRLHVTMADASGGGTFVVRLRGDVAPMMAAHVLELVRARYYDGGVWHRVEPDFVIQGAGPGTSEYVGYPVYFRDELGTVPHARGTIGMSTRGHDTGDAQWFINLRDNPRLNRDYTVFAEVVEGIDVVDGIMEGDVIATVRETP